MGKSFFGNLFLNNTGGGYGKTLRKGIITLTDQGIVSITNFGTGVIIARSCTREEFGLYAMGISAILILISVQSAVISMPYTVYSPRIGQDERSFYTGSSFLQQIAFSFLAMAILGGIGFGIDMISETEGLSAIMILLAVVIPFLLLREYGRQLFISRLEVHSALVIDIVVVVIQFAGLLYLFNQGSLSAKSAYYVIAIACLLASSVIYMQIRHHCRLRVTQAVNHFKMNWSIGKWASVSGIASLAGIQLYPWLMTANRGVEDTGILAACMGIVFCINPLIIGLGNFIAPHIMHAYAEDGAGRAHEMLVKCCKMFWAIMAVFSLGMLFVGGDLLRLAYGEQYVGYGSVVGILAFALSAEIISLPYNFGLHMLGRSEKVFVGCLINLVVTVTLGFWMLKLYGPLGVACGLLLGYSSSAIYRWAIYRRYMHFSGQNNTALVPEGS